MRKRLRPVSSGCGGAYARNDYATARDDNATALYVPVAGPFLQMTRTTGATGNVLNVVDGVVQSAGLAMLITGLASPERVLVRNDSKGIRALPVPFLTSHSAGVGLVASF